MSKHLFELMRLEEIATTDFLPTKKEIESHSKQFAKELVNTGDYDLYELFSQAERVANTTANIRDQIKELLPAEKHTSFGIEFSPMNGRVMIQFQEDDVWQTLKQKLSEREELLKVAMNSNDTIYDSEGVEVPKVSKKFAKDSLKITY